jgi:hypothetical protein
MESPPEQIWKEYICIQSQESVKGPRLDVETLVRLHASSCCCLISGLRRCLGGRLPPSIELRCPILDTRIKVDIPDFDSSVTPNYSEFSPENVVELCMRSLRTVREYEWLVQKAIDDGSSLQLAWRMETKLDWVWQARDVEGNPRDWDVLCGLSLKQVCHTYYPGFF